MILDLARILVFPALMAFAAVSDLLTMTISNRVSILLAVSFICLAALGGMNISEITSHVSAGALVLVVSFGCFAMGWMGGGDAKLAAGAGIWFGFGDILDFLLYASLFGGALTLILLQCRKFPLPSIFAKQEWLARLHSPETGIPYGVALAFGALLTFPDTQWIKAIDPGHFAGM